MDSKPTYEDLKIRINDLESKLEKSEYKQSRVEMPDHNQEEEETPYKREQEFRTLADNAPDIIYRFDHLFRHTYVNAAVEKATGIPKETFLGKDHRELGMPEDIVLFFQKQIRKVFDSGQENEFSFTFPTPTGEHHYESRYVPEFTQNGIVEHVMGITRNVTEHKQAIKALEESEARFKQLIKNSFDMIILMDSNGIQQFISESCEKILGYRPEELIGVPVIEKMIHPEDQELTKKGFLDIIENNAKGGTQYRHLHKNGSWVYLEAFGSNQLDNPDIKSVVLNVRDITERKDAEQIIKENEIHLKEINATKDKLFSIIAHDLRSPFNAILGFSELLIENGRNFEIDVSEKYLGIINSSAKNTLSLLDDLLDWVRTQSGQLHFKPVNLNLQQIIKKISGVLNSSATIKKISINHFYSDEIEILADKNMLRTILRNLISNAIKFTNPGGKVDILVNVNKNLVEITVKDNGVGMNEETQSNIFNNKEYLTTLGTENEKGLGLGLILCKEFVEKHGGEIWVESELGKGSNFVFSIPLSETNAGQIMTTNNRS